MRSRDDATLLGLYAREGDEAAFRELTLRYGALVYAACLKEVRRPELAEDAAQAVFLDLARKAGRVRVRTTLVPWLYAASRLAARNALRAERRRPTVPLDDSVVAPETVSDDALFQALDALSAPEREAVVLRFVQGLSLAEVGRAQGVSEDAARMRVQRALKRLRTEYVPALAAPLGLSEKLATLALPKPLPTMITPLVFATGGVAALAVTGAATVAYRRTPPAALPPPQALSAPAKAPPAFVQAPEAAESAKADPVLKSVPTIDKPFTLAYHLIERDLRTPTILDKEAEDYRRDAQRAVDADQMTPEQVEEAVERMRKPRSSEWDITLSFDGRTLYAACQGGDASVFLVRGSTTYRFPQNELNTPRPSPSVDDSYALWTFPLPPIGPSLPFVPLVVDGRTLVMKAVPEADGKPIRNRGRVEGKGGKVTRIVEFAPGRPKPYGITTLSDHRPINGFAVAGSVVYRERTQDGEPTRTREFRLTSASDQALPADRFVPETYLPEKTMFMVNRRGTGRAFEYDPAKGPLEAQIGAFRSRGQR